MSCKLDNYGVWEIFDVDLWYSKVFVFDLIDD